jgi:hypothetical protein
MCPTACCNCFPAAIEAMGAALDIELIGARLIRHRVSVNDVPMSALLDSGARQMLINRAGGSAPMSRRCPTLALPTLQDWATRSSNFTPARSENSPSPPHRSPASKPLWAISRYFERWACRRVPRSSSGRRFWRAAQSSSRTAPARFAIARSPPRLATRTHRPICFETLTRSASSNRLGHPPTP